MIQACLYEMLKALNPYCLFNQVVLIKRHLALDHTAINGINRTNAFNAFTIPDQLNFDKTVEPYK